MRLVTLFLFLSLLFNQASGQLNDYGLGGRHISDLAITSPQSYPEPFILAGTDSSGIYYHSLSDTQPAWETYAGFDDHRITALYVQKQGKGPVDYPAVYSAVEPRVILDDSTGYQDSVFIYTIKPWQSYWSPADSGLRNAEVGYMTDFSGIGYSGHEPPMPLIGCADNPYLYRYQGDVWQKAWTGDDNISVQKLTYSDRYLWAGGVFSSAVPSLVILVSGDDGQTWELVHNGFAPVHQCNDLAVVESVTDTTFNNAALYAAISGGVIKSSDGGTSWRFTGLKDDGLNITALTVNPSDQQHILAGGGDAEKRFVVYESFDGGKSWEHLQVAPFMPRIPLTMVTCMSGVVIDDRFVAFLGTEGDGVLRYEHQLTSVDRSDKQVEAGFILDQNYPNPFNPSTTIEFILNRPDRVTITIYDITGKAIETLLNANKAAGRHQITFDGSHLSNGVYLYRLTTDQGYSKMRKMILMK